MVKHGIYYEDGSYDLIKCPQCQSDETSPVKGADYEVMICTQCVNRFHIGEQGKKIVKILSEDEADPERAEVVSGKVVKDYEEYQDRAKRLRKEVRE